MARLTEQLTALMISINVRYKTHAGAKITGLPDELWPVATPAHDGRRGRACWRAGPAARSSPAGMLDVVGDGLTIIANTADDIEIYGAYVSPDPDLCTFWLADLIDERGWGLRDDSFAVMDALRDLGVDVWFNLGDRDLAIGIERSRRLGEGASLTETLAELGAALGVGGRVLPMCDEPVRTWVRARDAWTPFQEFMIRARGEGPIDDMQLRGDRRGAADARGARGDRRRRRDRRRSVQPGHLDRADPRSTRHAPGPDRPAAPVVAVSPVVDGAIVKGPTEAFMRWAGYPLSTDGDRRHATPGSSTGSSPTRPSTACPCCGPTR